MNDIGNLHVIDWYLHKALIGAEGTCLGSTSTLDFDITTEQREGWAYDD